MDDSPKHDIVEEAVDFAGDIAKSIGGELSKFGKSATSQIGGSQDQTSPSQPSNVKQDSTAAPASASTPGQTDEHFSLMSELKNIAKVAGSQVSGKHITNEEIAQLNKKDKEFSEAEIVALRAKINKIYQEYEAKKAQEKKQKEMEVSAQEQKKLVEKQEEKKIDKETNPAIAKTRAEIKNYGAE